MPSKRGHHVRVRKQAAEQSQKRQGLFVISPMLVRRYVVDSARQQRTFAAKPPAARRAIRIHDICNAERLRNRPEPMIIMMMVTAGTCNHASIVGRYLPPLSPLACRDRFSLSN